MYIEKANLSKQEENIIKLIGEAKDQIIYDFKLNDKVKSIQVNTYELSDGNWKLISGGGGQEFSDNEGRLLLGVSDISKGIRVSLQSKHNDDSNEYHTEPVKKTESMGKYTSMLGDLTEIIYETEIPLAIQILTNQNSVSCYNVEYFYTPKEYEKYNYEHVYAITIRFSEKTVSELSNMFTY